jgi:hypothetical protein
VVETARQASEKISLGAIVVAVISYVARGQNSSRHPQRSSLPCLNPVPQTSSGPGVAIGKDGLRFCLHKMPYRDAGVGSSNGQTADSEDEYEYEYDENETEVSQSRSHTWETLVLDLPLKTQNSLRC